MERKFSLYDIEQFMREAGATRITEDAVVDLERELSKLAEKLTDEALDYAKHAGRKKLIKRSDILLLKDGKIRRRPRHLIRVGVPGDSLPRNNRTIRV